MPTPDPRHTDAAAAYEAHATSFLRARDASLVGSRVVAQWARTLPPGADVLELACGGGQPITQALHEASLRLWAVDSSPTLLAEFARRFPSVTARCEKVQDSAFFGRRFDAVVAIGLMFLLPEADQIALIGRVAQALRPGGRFLFTAPIEVGQWTDLNTGLTCLSLGQARCEACLQVHGFRVLATVTDRGGNNHFDAILTG